MTNIKPGFWKSSLSEEQAISASKDYSQLECSPNGELYWVEQRPDDQGRNTLCRYSNGEVSELIAAGFSVHSKVHEYGGRSWCLMGDQLVFVNGQDQQIYKQSALVQEPPKRLTDTDTARYIEPVWDKSRNRLIAVQEVHDIQPEVINRLVAVDLESGELDVLHQEYDFYSYPEISDSGSHLLFISWNHPEQPWTSTFLSLSGLGQSGELDDCYVISGMDGGEALSQPCFLSEEQIGFISDRSGWWNLYVASFSGHVADWLSIDADIMSAPWQSGLKSCVNCAGDWFWVEQRHTGALLHWGDQDITPNGYTQFRSLAVSEERLFCVAAGPSKLPQIISISKEDGAVCEITSAALPVSESEISEPVAKVFGEKDRSHGYFYPATNSFYRVAAKAPVVVFLHGGPTASTYPVLNLKIQYWTQRGFSVVDLNYRGSSGYGRDYRMSLKGKWGSIEIEDIGRCLDQLVKEGLVDPAAMFIRGNSSGGYSALNAMCDLDCFAGGASLYGVTDPLALASVTHKFESRYLDWLIGSPDEDKEKYEALAPVNKADKISCPVIFFQGELDRVVVPDQTRAMLERLEQKRIKTVGVYFQDEAHGFRKRENQIKVLRDELCFYQEILSVE